MGYGILRVAKVKRDQLRGIIEHDFRLVDVHNANSKKEKDNFYSVPPETIEKRLDELVKIHQETTGKSIRKDAVQAVEILVAFSAESKKSLDVDKYFEDAQKFIKKKFPEVLAVVIHRDEKTPHMHVVVAPIKDNKFNAKEVVGTKKDLSDMQDQYFESVSKNHGLERGEKGTGREHIPVAKLRQKTEKNQVLQNENMRIKAKFSERQINRLENVEAKEQQLRSDAQKLEQDKKDFEYELRDLREDVKDLTKKNKKLEKDIKELEAYYKDRDVNKDLKKSNDQYKKDYIAVCNEKNELKNIANENAKALDIEKEKNAEILKDALDSQAEELTAKANKTLKKGKIESYERGKKEGLKEGKEEGKAGGLKILKTLGILTPEDLEEKQRIIKDFELKNPKKKEQAKEQGRSL